MVFGFGGTGIFLATDYDLKHDSEKSKQTQTKKMCTQVTTTYRLEGSWTGIKLQSFVKNYSKRFSITSYPIQPVFPVF